MSPLSLRFNFPVRKNWLFPEFNQSFPLIPYKDSARTQFQTKQTAASNIIYLLYIKKLSDLSDKFTLASIHIQNQRQRTAEIPILTNAAFAFYHITLNLLISFNVSVTTVWHSSGRYLALSNKNIRPYTGVISFCNLCYNKNLTGTCQRPSD